MSDLKREINIDYRGNSIVTALYRPYVKMALYYDKHLNGRIYQLPSIFIQIRTMTILVP